MPEPAQTVTAEEVAYATLDGIAVKGYLARPARGAAGGKPLPALIVIQEWWGLNDNIRAMARRFAGEGYLVLAVDLYEGKIATTSEEAMAAMQAAMQKPERLTENLRQAQRLPRDPGQGDEDRRRRLVLRRRLGARDGARRFPTASTRR